jgi:urea carboxylase
VNNDEVQLQAGHSPVESPVSGAVWKILVTRGQKVQSGDLLAILESMKMEVHLESPESGEITEILAAPGQSLSRGQILFAMKGG